MMSSILDRSPLLVSRRQARQLAAWAKGTGFIRSDLYRISKQGEYAYYTDRFVIIRWDVSGLDLPDGSWIDLEPGDVDGKNAKPDTLTNMAEWAKTVGPLASWDLMDAERWRKPDGKFYRDDLNTFFTRSQLTGGPVSFTLSPLEGVCLVVMPDDSREVTLAPSRGTGESLNHGWWVMSEDRRVAGMLRPTMPTKGAPDNPDEAGLPKPYEETKEEEER